MVNYIITTNISKSIRFTTSIECYSPVIFPRWVDDNGSPADITSGDITSYDCTTLVITAIDPMAPEELKYWLGLKNNILKFSQRSP
jgi:hypothetical protein